MRLRNENIKMSKTSRLSIEWGNWLHHRHTWSRSWQEWTPELRLPPKSPPLRSHLLPCSQKAEQHHLVPWADGDDDEEPDEGKDGPEHGDEKNCVRFHPASFILGDHKHAEGRCSWKEKRTIRKNCPIYQDFRRRGGLHLIALITRRLKAPEPMIRLRRRFFNLIQKSVLLIHNHYLQSLSTIIMWWQLFFYLMPRGSALKSLKRMPIIESSISGAVLRWQEKENIQWN